MKLKRFVGKVENCGLRAEKSFLISEVEHLWWVHEKDNKWNKAEFKFTNDYVHIWVSRPGHDNITPNSRK